MATLSDDWTAVRASSQEATDLASELCRELSPDHALAAEQFVAVAVRRHRKDCIFWLPDSQRWALVHLTWTREVDARWPSAEVLVSWGAVVASVRDAGRG